MSKRTVVQLLGLTVVMAVTVVARPVAANPQMIRERAVSMGVDVGAAITRSEGVDSTTGPGFLVRAGYEFGTGVTPELILSYSHWNRTLLGFDVTESQVSVLPGVRWSILGGAFRPWISLHFGYGKLSTSIMGSDTSMGGTGVNTGAGLDWMFMPKVGVGVHVSWNKVITSSQSNNSMQEGEAWVDLGAGLALLW